MADTVEITPTDLKFRFALNKQLLSTISISNRSETQRIAFKIKTTAPKKYVVRPSSGVVEPRTSQAVQVIMQAQKDYPPDFQAAFKDKFMVQTTVMAPNEQVDKDTFSKDVRGDLLREVRLKVVMEGPPAPPSPVPEANEAADGDAAADHGPAATAAGLPGVRAAPAGVDSTRLRGDLASAATENSHLRAQVDQLARERDELRKKLDYVELQTGGIGSAGPPKPVSRAYADPAMKFRLTIVHILLVAIVAFLIGHYTG